jgi:hypothetical protein
MVSKTRKHPERTTRQVFAAVLFAALGLGALAAALARRPAPISGPLSDSQRRWVVAVIRAQLSRRPPPEGPDADRVLEGPLVASLYLRGKLLVRERVEGQALAETTRALSQALARENRSVADLASSRIKIDASLQGVTDSFVESADGDVIRLPPPEAPPAATGADLTAAAHRAGDYLLAHLHPDGSFDYEYDTAAGRAVSAYNLRRHAGAAALLGALARGAPESRYAEGASRSVRFLLGLSEGSCARGPERCVRQKDVSTADLGITALALLAAVELERATGDGGIRRYEAAFARFLVDRQEADGGFCDSFLPDEGRCTGHPRTLYSDGEAALALARYAALVNERPLREAAIRALRQLVRRPALEGRRPVSEHHWTCQTAVSLWPALSPVDRAESSAFCSRYAASLRRAQMSPDDPAAEAHPERIGSYGTSPLRPVSVTEAGSGTEAAIAAAWMERQLGVVSRELEAQVDLGLRYLVSRQLHAALEYEFSDPGAADGGFLESEASRVIRIDTVQHCGFAFLRASGLAD